MLLKPDIKKITLFLEQRLESSLMECRLLTLKRKRVTSSHPATLRYSEL
ncbi:hypothetical protein KPL33_09030 [Clostridium algidicarnis]|nr:hypothetical protein [Clostridium algidicarnis]MBU3207120.1 hypothetical protein [Clostridium algidicarnis]